MRRNLGHDENDGENLAPIVTTQPGQPTLPKPTLPKPPLPKPPRVQAELPKLARASYPYRFAPKFRAVHPFRIRYRLTTTVPALPDATPAVKTSNTLLSMIA